MFDFDAAALHCQRTDSYRLHSAWRRLSTCDTIAKRSLDRRLTRPLNDLMGHQQVVTEGRRQRGGGGREERLISTQLQRGGAKRCTSCRQWLSIPARGVHTRHYTQPHTQTYKPWGSCISTGFAGRQKTLWGSVCSHSVCVRADKLLKQNMIIRIIIFRGIDSSFVCMFSIIPNQIHMMLYEL